MGLFDKISDAISGEDGSDSKSKESRDDGKVDPDRRADIIANYYSDITPKQAEQVADILKEYVDYTNGAQRREIVDTIENDINISRELAERIVHNEQASIMNMNTVKKYREQFDVDNLLVYLPGKLDERAHPVRVEVVEKIEGRGGAVSIDVLQELFREAAEKYESEGGTPERVEHWVAHEKPRYAITRHVDP